MSLTHSLSGKDQDQETWCYLKYTGDNIELPDARKTQQFLPFLPITA